MIRNERGGVLKTALIVVAVLVVLAAFGAGGRSKEDKKVSSSNTASEATEQPAEEAPAEPEPDFSALSIGQTVTYKNGLDVSVVAVNRGLTNYSGDPVTGITVSYVNNGTDTVSFGTYDWDGEDASGVQRSPTIIVDGTDELNSGKLSPGGSITGNVYFEGDIVRAIYTENIFLDDSVAAWIL